jgi:hypothetical protein
VKKGRTSKRAFGLFLCLALVAGCHRSDVPTAEENRELDNTEAMLDAAPGTLNAIDDSNLSEADSNQAAPSRDE